MELVSVAALDDARVIGKDGELPWHLPADKRQYRRRIANDPVVLGRRTFDAMRDDLPGSAQIVLSRTERTYDIETAYHASTVAEAVDIATALDAEVAYVIGGGAIYALFQPHLDRMVLSRVPGEHDGDTYYPEWDPTAWTLEAETDYEGFTLEEWRRRDD